jgi:hypothetical protein
MRRKTEGTAWVYSCGEDDYDGQLGFPNVSGNGLTGVVFRNYVSGSIVLLGNTVAKSCTA